MKLFRTLKVILCFLSLCFSMVLFSTNAYAAGKTVTIVIDPGHGGPATKEANLGAGYDGLVEKDMNLITANALKTELEKYGNVKVYLSRTSDVELSLKDRIDYAKSVNADFVISVHHNASSNHLLYGSEIFVPSEKLYADGYSLASCIMERWKSAGRIDKGIKTRIGKNGDYYGLIRIGAQASIPTIILEHGYMDNSHDSVFMNEPSEWKENARLDAMGIADYYGLKKGENKKSVYGRNSVKTNGSVIKDDVTPPALSMQINSYDVKTGALSYTLTGIEPESRLYLYGIAPLVIYDNGGNLIPATTDYLLWGDSDSVSGTIMMPAGYVGAVYAMCYNNYNLPSNVVTAYIGY